MAKKPFQTLSNGEKYKYYNKRHKLCVAGKWTAIVAPFGIVFGVKFNEYVKIIDTGETIKLTIGCILAIIVAAIAIFNEVKHSDSTKHLAPVIGWGLALAFVWLFKVILQDLFLIVAAEFAGQCAACGIDAYGKFAGNEAQEYKKLARGDNTLGVKQDKKIKLRIK